MDCELRDLVLTVDFDVESEEYEDEPDYPFEDVFGGNAGSGPPPWYGFPPRVLGVDLEKPFKPSLALWREGKFVDLEVIDEVNYQPSNPAHSLLKLGDIFADYCRERGLFGAHLVIPDYSRTGNNLQVAVWAFLIAEAEWAGLIVGRPLPPARYRDGAKGVASAGPRRLNGKIVGCRG